MIRFVGDDLEGWPLSSPDRGQGRDQGSAYLHNVHAEPENLIATVLPILLLFLFASRWW